MWVGMGQAPALAQSENLHCRAKFRTCALFLKKWLWSSCVLNVRVGVLRVGLYVCVSVFTPVFVLPCVYLPVYLSVCLSMCVKGGTEVRDRG